VFVQNRLSGLQLQVAHATPTAGEAMSGHRGATTVTVSSS
jgi:hypothetical protein